MIKRIFHSEATMKNLCCLCNLVQVVELAKAVSYSDNRYSDMISLYLSSLHARIISSTHYAIPNLTLREAATEILEFKIFYLGQ